MIMENLSNSLESSNIANNLDVTIKEEPGWFSENIECVTVKEEWKDGCEMEANATNGMDSVALTGNRDDLSCCYISNIANNENEQVVINYFEEPISCDKQKNALEKDGKPCTNEDIVNITKSRVDCRRCKLSVRLETLTTHIDSCTPKSTRSDKTADNSLLREKDLPAKTGLPVSDKKSLDNGKILASNEIGQPNGQLKSKLTEINSLSCETSKSHYEALNVNGMLLKDSTYSCSICSFTTDKNRTYKRHLRNHQDFNLPVLPCPYCSQRYTKPSLFRHMRKVHPGQRFQVVKPDVVNVMDHKSETLKCDKCNFVCLSSVVLTNHQIDKHQIDITSCPLCSYVSSYSSQLQQHLKFHETSETIKCRRCDYRGFVKTVKKHEKKRHYKTSSVIKCSASEKLEKKPDLSSAQTSSVVKSSESKKHEKKPDLSSAKSSESKKHEEKPDLSSAKTSSVIKRSESKKHEEKPDLSSASTSSVKSSESKKHEEKPDFSSAKTSSVIKRSESKKHEGKPDLSSASTSSVKSSESKKHEKKPDLSSAKTPNVFKCLECSYTSTRRNHLLLHGHCHQRNEPILDCPRNCGLKFTPMAWKIHLRNKCSYNKIPLFKCTMCIFTSRLRMQVHIHMKKEHGLDSSEAALVIYRDLVIPLQHYNEKGQPKTRPTSINKPKHTFQCSKCPFSTDLRIKLNAHFRTHEDMLKCIHCPFKTVIAKEYEQHLETNHKNKCQKCSFTTKRLHYLKIHLRTHDRSPMMKCPHCNFKTTKSHLRTHIVKHDPKTREVVTKKRFQCQLCSASCLHRCRLKVHMMTHYQGQPIEQCPRCNFKSTNHALQAHMAKKNCNINKDVPVLCKSTETTKFNCALCPFSTSLRIKLKSHETKVHSNANKNTSEAVDLPPPVSLPTSTSPILYNCNLCSYTSASEKKFHVHTNNHVLHNLPIFQCQYCKFKGTKSTFKGHSYKCERFERISSKKQLFQVLLSCSNCSFGTYSPLGLKEHQESCNKLSNHVSLIKNYKCKYCSFASYWQYVVERHTKTCSNIRVSNMKTSNFVKVEKL